MRFAQCHPAGLREAPHYSFLCNLWLDLPFRVICVKYLIDLHCRRAIGHVDSGQVLRQCEACHRCQ
jgi:hypothetical protein